MTGIETETEDRPGGIRLTLTVNGRARTADRVPPGMSLLTALREHFDLPGSKNACEQGECGSCTLYLDDEPVCSCLVAAGQAQGRDVRTVEGLAAAEGVPGAVQRAFIECGAVQCGFCTPGLIVAVDALVRHCARAGGSGPGESGPSERQPGERQPGGTQPGGTQPGDAELDEAVIREQLAGNLCRCTGYEKIIEAVRVAARHVREAAA